jgi:benzoyl-CoA 2,3-dioxygenase component B
MASRISTFDDWVDLFREWQKEIGVDHPLITEYKFEAKYGQLKTSEIEFGEFRGERKWEKVLDIPDQRIRDGLLNLIVYQGDTEFASVEQQRYLLEKAPSEYDLQAIARVMTEEMRHGWQMCHLLISHYGRSGKLEAMKQLERRAFENKRLLKAFNDPVQNWLDFYTYTDFFDRERQVPAHHAQLLGLRAAGQLDDSHAQRRVLPPRHRPRRLAPRAQDRQDSRAIVQRYLNKWIPSAYDLFGVDHSSSAHWFYNWGLKGRYDEHASHKPVDVEHLNEHSRGLYQQECEMLVGQLNKLIPDDQPKLFVPDVKFYRRIGDYAGQPFSVTGERLSDDDWKKHIAEVLPTENDLAALAQIFEEGNWVETKQSTTRAQ